MIPMLKSSLRLLGTRNCETNSNRNTADHRCTRDRETIYKAQKSQPAEINRLSEAEKTYWTKIAEAKKAAKNRSQMEH